MHHESHSAEQGRHTSHKELVGITVAVPLVLVAQGWTHMIPLAVGISVCATYPQAGEQSNASIRSCAHGDVRSHRRAHVTTLVIS
jgi:hypothetical protein